MSEFSPEELIPKDVSPLIGLGDVSLDDVARMDDSALAHTVSWILGDMANSDEVIFTRFSAAD